MSRLETFRKQDEATRSLASRKPFHWRPHSQPVTISALDGRADPEAEISTKLKREEIIAREAGFESWVVLKTSKSRWPADTENGWCSSAIKAAFPWCSSRTSRTRPNSFRDKLGFSIEFLHGNPAFYGGVSRNGVTLHLRFVPSR